MLFIENNFVSLQSKNSHNNGGPFYFFLFRIAKNRPFVY
jgi:hypothetical protein